MEERTSRVHLFCSARFVFPVGSGYVRTFMNRFRWVLLGEDLRDEHIYVKEMWAVLKVLQALPESVSDFRIDATVDSLLVFHA